MAKSILEIDVKDEAFKRFTEDFNRYKEALAQTPGAWADVGKETAGLAEGFASMTAALMAQQKLLHRQTEEKKVQEKAEREAAKNRSEADKAAARAAAERARANRQAISDTKQIAHNVAGATADLLKWVGLGSIFSGLLGAGGLWGLDALANGVGASRRQSQGLGVSTAARQSLGVNFQRYFDTDTNLENIAEAKSDYSRRWAFNAMGVNPGGKDPAALAAEMAIQAKKLFDHSDQSQQFAESRGLTQFYTMDELRRLHNTSMEELALSERQYQQDKATFSLTDATNRKWQDFSVQMGRASQGIQNTFVDALTPLIPAFTDLSKAFAEAIEIFLKNPHLKEWFTEFGDGLKSMAKYVSSAKFQNDIKTFMDDMGQLAAWVKNALVTLGIIKETPNETKARRAKMSFWDKMADPTWNYWDGWPDGNNAPQPPARGGVGGGGRPGSRSAVGAIAGFFKSQGWTGEQAAGITANLNRESPGFNPFAVGDRGEAYGIAQWHADRQAEYAKHFGHSMQSVTDMKKALAEQLLFVQYELTRGLRRYAGEALRRESTAYGAGDVVSRLYESPVDREGEARRRGQSAQVIVTIVNQTGAQVSVTGSQIAQ